MVINDRIILGIDPGTLVMGYGLVHIQNNKLSLIALGVIKLDKYDEHSDRLKKIFAVLLYILGARMAFSLL